MLYVLGAFVHFHNMCKSINAQYKLMLLFTELYLYGKTTNLNYFQYAFLQRAKERLLQHLLFIIVEFYYENIEMVNNIYSDVKLTQA